MSKALSVRFDIRDDEAIREFLTHDLYRQRGGELTEAFGSSWVGEVYAAFSAAARGTRLDTDKLDESLPATVRFHLTKCLSIRFERRSSVRPIALPWQSSRWLVKAPSCKKATRSSPLRTSSSSTPLRMLRRWRTSCSRRTRCCWRRVLIWRRPARQRKSMRPPGNGSNARFRELEFEMETQRRAAQDREEALTRDLARHGAHLAALQRHLFARHAQIDQFAANAARSQASIAQLFSLIAALRTHVEAYERSHSWRMTAPLRAIGRGSHDESPLSSLDVELSALRLRAGANGLPDGFDRAAYLTLNPDVAASGIDPGDHYLTSGCHEGRAYSREHPEGFDPAAYLALNPDVAANGLNPADHYLSSGRQEGRAYSASFQTGSIRLCILR